MDFARTELPLFYTFYLNVHAAVTATVAQTAARCFKHFFRVYKVFFVKSSAFLPQKAVELRCQATAPAKTFNTTPAAPQKLRFGKTSLGTSVSGVSALSLQIVPQRSTFMS